MRPFPTQSMSIFNISNYFRSSSNHLSNFKQILLTNLLPIGIAGIIGVLVFYKMAIKLKFPFWSKQPIYSTADILFWFVSPKPGIIHDDARSNSTKYVDYAHVRSHLFTELPKENMDVLMDLLQNHFLNDREAGYFYKPPRSLLEASLPNQEAFVSIYRDDNGKAIGCASGRPFFCYHHNTEDVIYNIDHLCVHSGYRKRGIAPATMQTHEQVQRKQNPHQSRCSFFKRERKLPLLVPLCRFKTYDFLISNLVPKDRIQGQAQQVQAEQPQGQAEQPQGQAQQVQAQPEAQKAQKPPNLTLLPQHYSITKIHKQSLSSYVEFIQNNRHKFDFFATPSFTTQMDLLNANLTSIFALIHGGQIRAIFWLRDAFTTTPHGAACECASLLADAQLPLKDVALGLKEAIRLFSVERLSTEAQPFHVFYMEGLGHAKAVLDILKNEKPLYQEPMVLSCEQHYYYLYNYRAAELQPDKCCVLYS